MGAGGSTLVYGIHLGQSQLQRELPGFSVSLLQPTLHEKDVALHTHDSASLILVLEGSYRTSADGPKLCSGPTLIFNPAGTVHRDSFVVPKGRFLALSVSPRISHTSGSEDQLPRVAVSFTGGQALAVAKELARKLKNGSLCSAYVLEDACWELLGAVSGGVYRKRSRTAPTPQWLAEARSMLIDNVEEQSITSLASELGIHPVYLAKRFRQQFGCSPAEYRMRCRLGRAVERLRQGKSSLATIASKGGFFDQSHFAHAFKAEFGYSPGVYRRRLGSAE